MELLWSANLFVNLINFSLLGVFLLSEYREIAGVMLWYGFLKEEVLVKTTLRGGGLEGRFMVNKFTVQIA